MIKSNFKKGYLPLTLFNWPILSLISSFLLVLSFPIPGMSIIAWIALVPFFIVITRESLSRVIFATIIVNFTFNFFYLIWLKEYKQPLTFPLSLVAELLYLMPQVIFSWLIYHITPRYLKTLMLASVWIFFDYLKTIGFLAFPWGIVGYTQYRNTLLIQTSSIFGVWGIDLLIVFFNSSLAIFIIKIRGEGMDLFNWKSFETLNLVISILFIIFSVVYGLFVLKNDRYSGEKSIKLSLIQPNFDPWSPNLNKSLEKEFSLTMKSLKYNPDMIIWSESSVPFPFDYYLAKKNVYALKIDSFIKRTKRPFIIGSLSFQGVYKNGRFRGKFYNVAYYYEPGKGYDYYRKMHLVPFGEWFPYKKLFPFAARILEKAGAGDFSPGTSFKVFKYEDLAFNVLICFEDVFGNLARKFVQNGSRLMINITNDAWSGSEKAEVQHFSISVFRAIENRVPLVRVANGGVTVYLDPYGRIVERLPLFKSDYLVCNVKYKPTVSMENLTFYTKHGDFLPFSMITLVIFVLLVELFIKIVDIILNRNNM